MFNWILNKSLNFDLFYLLLVDIWKWLVCLVPWEKFFSLSSMQFRSTLGFLSDDRFQIESKKQAQWFSNILICDIRCLDNCPRGKVPPVGLGLGLVLGLGGTILWNLLYYNKFIRSWANIFNEAYWTYSLMTNTYQWKLKRQAKIFLDIWSL